MCVSPGLKPGRGLKQHQRHADSVQQRRLARLKTRAWIETMRPSSSAISTVRLARLKTRAWIETSRTQRHAVAGDSLARLKTRAWIETAEAGILDRSGKVSPGLKPGRGLKHEVSDLVSTPVESRPA
ncbi:hypothetical protein THIARS_80246 [Thiomonas delicata]|uniref:Uncharacterized protein n=1 Tax=Thiomonas delicata TaxID=364030 RepID=A0A238D990_THIDL|nr:hypothetical protein THIARS_80246 [Thiomonas delicata]